MKMSYRNIVIRALKTGIQSFLAVLVAAGTGYVHLATVKGAAIAGGAALISAVNNALVSEEG